MPLAFSLKESEGIGSQADLYWTEFKMVIAAYIISARYQANLRMEKELKRIEKLGYEACEQRKVRGDEWFAHTMYEKLIQVWMIAIKHIDSAVAHEKPRSPQAPRPTLVERLEERIPEGIPLPESILLACLVFRNEGNWLTVYYQYLLDETKRWYGMVFEKKGGSWKVVPELIPYFDPESGSWKRRRLKERVIYSPFQIHSSDIWSEAGYMKALLDRFVYIPTPAVRAYYWKYIGKDEAVKRIAVKESTL